MTDVLTVSQAASFLRVTPRRIQALINAGALPAERFGRSWMIRHADLRAYHPKPPGRPPAKV